MSIKKDWEERSKKYGMALEGVLPKSFPRPVNNTLDHWMYSCIKASIPSNQPFKVLDLGCGYGRLSQKILKDFKKSQTVGVDISSNYVSLYNKNLKPRGKATVGDIKKLAFKANSFDMVIMVTTLMYLTTNKEQKIAIKEIMRVLKPAGVFVFIERNNSGYKMVTLGGLLSREITSVSFNPSELKKMIKDGGGKVTKLAGNPFWTLTLPFLFVLAKLSPPLATSILFYVNKLDRIFGYLLTPSFYIAYSGLK